MITSPELKKIKRIRHGFFGSKGGVSTGIYTSLNCGPGSGDDKKNVAENRARAMQMLDAKPESLCTLYQCHSDKVITVEDTYDKSPEADALATRTPGLVLGILAADCTPVLFADSKNNVIGAAHAGWKPAFGGILENTVEAMVKLGAEKKHITAAIGPCIRQASYEVGPEFRIRFMEAEEDNQRFFIPSKKPGHFMFDMPAYITKRLERLGILTISDVKRDTCAEREDFFSYRRNCLEGLKDYGRQLSAITLI